MIALGYPNRPATASGGSWLAAAPVTNVTTADFTNTARSTDATTTSTKILLDLGAAYPLRFFALANTNLSDAATWVIKLGTTSGAGDLLTTSSGPVWQLGGETALAAVGVNDTLPFYRRQFQNIYVHSAFISARYVTFELSDTANAAGFVEVGRAFASGGYVPSVNASYGLKDGITDLSSKTKSESGAQTPAKRRRIRNVSFVLEQRTMTEADMLHDMQRMLGTVEEVLYVPDIDDAALTQRYGFIGTMRELSFLEYPYYNRRALPVSLEEIV